MENATLQVLSKCNITPKYKGYTYLPVAVRLANQYMREPLCIMADIYPVIGQMIYVVAKKSRAGNPEGCRSGVAEQPGIYGGVMGFGAKKCPGSAQFIDALVYYINWKMTHTSQQECRGILETQQ